MFKKAILSLSFVISLQTTFAMEMRLGGLEALDFLSSLSGLKNKINLTDKNVLKSLLAEPFQEDNICLSQALEIAQSVYEVQPRVIETNLSTTTKYGMAFPIHPEIIADVMRSCVGKVILEIGGASGENATLFAFAGAKHVYMNDIEPNEVRKFDQRKEKLPSRIKDCLTSLCCNIFDLSNHENLLSQIDIIYCRNLLHFFTDKQLEVFFPLLRSFLKPGGQVIFSTNSAYHPSFSSIISENPSATRFTRTVCQLFDYDKNGRMPIRDIFVEISVCEEDLSPLEYEKLALLKKLAGTPKEGGTDGKWFSNTVDINKLDQRIREKFNEEKNKPEIKELCKAGKNISVELLKNTTRAYTSENLENIFAKNGFVIDRNFFISGNGHETSRYFQPPHVGIIGTLKISEQVG